MFRFLLLPVLAGRDAWRYARRGELAAYREVLRGLRDRVAHPPAADGVPAS